jgi:hypothetical protein
MMAGADPGRGIRLRLAASLLALIAGIAAVVIVIELVRTTLG